MVFFFFFPSFFFVGGFLWWNLNRLTKGSAELDAYLSNKHDQLLERLLEPNTYKKRSSLAIVDGFAVEITEKQVSLLGLKHIIPSFNVISGEMFVVDDNVMINASGSYPEIS